MLLDINTPSRECVKAICQKFPLDRYDDIESLQLTILPRPEVNSVGPGFSLDSEEVLLASFRKGLFDPTIDVLDVCIKCIPVSVVIDHPGKVQIEPRTINLDYYRPLYEQIPTLRIALGISEEELYSFELKVDGGTIWMNAQRALYDYGFDSDTSQMIVHSVNSLFKRFRDGVVRGTPDKVGYLYKQSSGRDVMRWFGEPIASKDLTKKKRRWFVLREMFLGYFKSTQDDTPAGVVPLDYYVMRISDEKAKDKTIILERKYEVMNVKSTSAYLVLTIEDASESELRDWFSIMSHQCVNTGINRVFGQPLAIQLSARRYKPYRIPPIVAQTIAFLDQYGLDMEGLFRLSGNSHEVSEYKEKYDCGDMVSFDKDLSPHVTANLLKAWCRELPEPLITFKLYPAFLYACNRHETDAASRAGAVLMLLDQLPEYNIIILQKICSLLKRVALQESTNRMGLSNLALVFGPNVLRPERDLDPISMLRDTPVINEAMQILISSESHMEDIIQRKFSPSILSPRRGNPNFNAKRLQRSGPRGGIPPPQWHQANPQASGWQPAHASTVIPDIATSTYNSNTSNSNFMTSTFGSSTITFSLEDTLGGPQFHAEPPTMTSTVPPIILSVSALTSTVEPQQPSSPRKQGGDQQFDRKARRGGKFDSNEIRRTIGDSSNPSSDSRTSTSLESSPRALRDSATSSASTSSSLNRSNDANSISRPETPVAAAVLTPSSPPMASAPSIPIEKFNAMEQELSQLKTTVDKLEAALLTETKARKELESKLLLLMSMQSS